MKGFGELVGIAFVEAVEIGLHDVLDGGSILAHGLVLPAGVLVYRSVFERSGYRFA